MKEIKTCEDYVLNELLEQKKEIKKLTEERDTAESVCGILFVWLEKLKPYFTLRRASDGTRLIDMQLIFEDYKPEAFEILMTLFELEEKT